MTNLEREYEKAVRAMDLIERMIGAELDEHVNHITNGAVFAFPGLVEERRAAFIKEFGPDKLECFYPHRNMLAMYYRHEDGLEVVYYDAEPEARLARDFPNCRIERSVKEEIEEVVVCDMSNLKVVQ
jgi:hypothetical protein